jgi:hypothetical protein
MVDLVRDNSSSVKRDANVMTTSEAGHRRGGPVHPQIESLNRTRSSSESEIVLREVRLTHAIDAAKWTPGNRNVRRFDPVQAIGARTKRLTSPFDEERVSDPRGLHHHAAK